MVKQRIPLDKEGIDGPHTHLLPQIILNKVRFPIPVDDHLCVQIQVDPFGSVIDGNGNYLDWPGLENDKFQSLLKKYGEVRYIENKLKTKNTICNLLEKRRIVCDKNYHHNLRRAGLNTLERIRAINFLALKKMDY